MPHNIIEGKFEGLSINYVCWKWQGVLQTANCCKLVCTLEVYILKGGGENLAHFTGGFFSLACLVL